MKKKQPVDNMELEVTRAFISRKSDQEIGMPDVEQELVLLKARRKEKTVATGQNGGFPLRKIAAVLVAILILSSLGYAAVRTSFFTKRWEKQQVAEAECPHQDGEPACQPVTKPETTLLGDSAVLYKDVRLDSIMMQIDQYYKVESQFADSEAYSIRLLFKWNRKHDLDEVLQRLNGFERFQIHREGNTLIVEQPQAEL